MNPRDELDALIAEYRRALHTLAGSAGTFGLRRLSEAARAAETYVRGCGASLDEAQRAELDRLLDILRHKACIT